MCSRRTADRSAELRLGELTGESSDGDAMDPQAAVDNVRSAS